MLIPAVDFEDDLARIRKGEYPDWQIGYGTIATGINLTQDGPPTFHVRKLAISIRNSPSFLMQFQMVSKDDGAYWQQCG
jgi:hypothetical protein